MNILYGVSFIEPIGSLPPNLQKGIPGSKSWEHWHGWSVEVKGARVIISQEAIDLSDDSVSGVPPSAREEQMGNGLGSIMRLSYSVPIGVCILHYLEGKTADGSSKERSPTPPALKYIEERSKAKPVGPPPGVPVSTYQGPPVTPMRAVKPTPPGPVRPPEPPPSTIIMDDEEAMP